MDSKKKYEQMLEDGEITKDAMELYNLSKLAPPIPRKQVDVGDEDLYMFVLDFEDGKVYKYLYPEAVENEEGKVVDNDGESYLEMLGHRATNCEWMITKYEEIIDEGYTKFD